MSTILARLESLEQRVLALEHAPHPAPSPQRTPTPLEPEPSGQEHLLPAAPAALRLVDEPAPVGAEATPPPVPPEPPATGDTGLEPAPARLAAPASAAPPAERPGRDFEAWFGGVLLGRVGIGAVVLAAAYFAQLAYRHVSDGGKVLSLYLLAGALIGAGRLLRSRAGGRYVALLWGGGVAVAYVAGLAATLRYGLVGPWTGLGLLAGACVLGHLLSRILKNEVLATVSIVSAYVAPFLLGVALSRGPWILAYAAAVHSGAAWSERLWGWRSARAAALLGSALLACAWVGGQGTDHLRTVASLHGLALLLLAQDLLGAWHGRSARTGVAVGFAAGLGLLGLWLVAFEAIGPAFGPSDLRGATLGAGALWLSIAALGSWRARPAAPQLLLRVLGTLGGLLATVGGALVWDEHGLCVGPLLSLALLAAGLLALRRLLRLGDVSVFLGALLSLGIVGGQAAWVTGTPAGLASAPYAWLLLLPALVPAALLVLAARSATLRVLGLVAGAGTLGLAFLSPALQGNAAWAAVALLLPGIWALGAHERARAAGDRVVASAAGVLGLVVAVSWALTCFPLGRPPGWAGALDPHTWCALALAGGLLHLRARTLSRQGPGDYRPVAMLAVVGLALLAGGREVDLLTRHLAPSAHSMALALFLAAAGLALALHARTGARLGRAATALACLGAAPLLLLAQALAGPLDVPLLVGLLGAGLATAVGGGLLRERGGERPDWLGVSVAPFAGLALAWLTAVAAHPGAFQPALWNLRFAGGAGLLALLAVSTWRSVAVRSPLPVRWTLGIGALLVGYVAGLFELVQATRALEGAWAPVLVSLYTALFAGAMLAVGFHWSQRGLRYAALVVLGALVLKVGLHDLAASDLPLRVLVTGVLGLVLLGSAYAYAHRRRAPDAPPPEPPAPAPLLS